MKQWSVVGGRWPERVARVFRAILGAPDYDQYLAHVRQCHPEREPLSREEFVRWRLERRYSTPGNRCC